MYKLFNFLTSHMHCVLPQYEICRRDDSISNGCLTSEIHHTALSNIKPHHFFLTRPGTRTEYCAAAVWQKRFPLFTLKLGQRSKTNVRGMNSGRQQLPSSANFAEEPFKPAVGLLFDIENVGFWWNIPLIPPPHKHTHTLSWYLFRGERETRWHCLKKN